MNLKLLLNWGKLAVVVVLLIWLAIDSVHTTGTTEVGVRTVKWSLFSKAGIEDRAYQPGATYFFLPVFNDWSVFDTRLQVVEMTAAGVKGSEHGVDDIPFKTKDGNDIRIDVIFSYRIDPTRAPYIREFVAGDMLELKEKVFRTVARSKPRDFFGGFSTEEFYHASNRNIAAENAQKGLQEILKEYGLIVESVALMDYRFKPEYTKIITDKKVADARTKSIESERLATMELNKKLLQDAQGMVNERIAQADGKYQEAVLTADAYYQQQTNLAAATIKEGEAEATGIKKMREAMMNEGGLAQVKMKIAENLKNKRIIMVPMGSPNSINLQTLDLNDVLRQIGFTNSAARR